MAVNVEWEILVKGGFFADYSYEARRRYQKAAAAIQLPKDVWIVEVGCGTGRFHKALRQLGYGNVISCDLTLEHIRQARFNSPEGMFVVASGERLPFRDGVFDSLVSNAAIEHFADPGRGVREFARVTNRSARLVVTSDCYIWRIMQLLGLYRSKMPIDRTLTHTGFRRLFESAGLKITEADCWGITHYLRRFARRWSVAESWLSAAMQNDHWSNVPAKYWITNRARMVLLDENIFRLRKETESATHTRPQSARELMRLSEILACPECRSALVELNHGDELACDMCQRRYPVVDGIPILN